MSRAKVDIRDKRPWETHLQWRSRVARLDAIERDRSQPLVTPEAEQHGDYRSTDVMHVETQTRAVTKRNMMQSALRDMRDRGGITREQFLASLQIASAIEAIERAVSISSSVIEYRVDCKASSRDYFIENLHAVRTQVAYTKWRITLPTPKRMIIDMILYDRNLVRIAHKYRTPWRTARKFLIDALDRWDQIFDDVASDIDEDMVVTANMQASGVISAIGTPSVDGAGDE